MIMLMLFTDEEKSNMLNSYFSKCWNHSEPPLTDSLEDSYVQCDEVCLDHLLCTVQRVVQLIRGLNVSKANVPDGFSARMLKATSDSIAPSLTNLTYPSLRATSPKCGRYLELYQFLKPKPNIVHLGADQYLSSRYPANSLKKHFHSLITDQLTEHYPLSEHSGDFRREIHSNSSACCHT